MDSEEELEMYRQQGRDHAEEGIDCPPSDRLEQCVLRSTLYETTLEEADEAYYEGFNEED